MAHRPYATAAEATQCLLDGITIVRGGTANMIVNKAALGEHEHAIQGFIHGMVLGVSDGPFMALDTAAEENLGAALDDFADALATSCPDRCTAAVLAEVKSPNVGGPLARRIDWAKWLKFFITTVLPIILV